MLPLELTHYPSWVVWRFEDRDGKPTKMPYQPRNLLRASVTEPSHWSSYAEALRLLRSGHGNFNGLGFVLSDSDPYSIIDLDDPGNDVGSIERAQKILDAFNNTYTEMSPSGNGMHIIVRGKIGGKGRRRGKIELYSRERYFTMTGNTYRDAPIESSDYFLTKLWEELGGSNAAIPLSIVSDRPQLFTDEEIYIKASETNEKFLPLFQGRYQEWYTSQSEADWALVNIISFYSRNEEQIARLFHYSELGKRPKAKRKDYLANMITRSFDNQLPDISLDALMGNLHIQIQAQKEAERKDPAPMLGVGWTLPPGLVGTIAKFIYDASPRPVHEISLAGALGLMAGICGRSYNISNTGLNHYILVLATTGRGKEAAKSGISKLMKRVSVVLAGAGDFIGPGHIASGQALMKYVGKNPCFVSILGEFGQTFEKWCGKYAGPNDIELRKQILDLFMKSGINESLDPSIYSDSKNATSVVKAPAMSILAETTPDSFYPILTEQMVASGLIPRFTCIEYTGKRVEENKHHVNAEPTDELIDTLTTLCANALTLQSRNEAIKVQTDSAGAEYIEKFNLKCDDQINNAESEVARQLWTRGHLKLLKLAGLIAVGVDIFQPVVTLDIAQWAANVVEKDIANMLNQFASGRVGSGMGEQQQTAIMKSMLMDYIRRPFDETMEKYCVNSAMHSDKVIQWSYIGRRISSKREFKEERNGAAFAMKRCIDLLIADGAICEVPQVQLLKRYNATGKAYAISELRMLS